jgi:hypothetical protein
MTRETKPPSSRGFTPSEAPTVKHTLAADAVAHLYEIREELDSNIKAIEAIRYDSQLRMEIVKGLNQLKRKIRSFEKYLGIY